jgi:hypothetical protein
MAVVVVPKELGTSKERIKPSQSDWASPAGRAERTWYVKKKIKPSQADWPSPANT